MVKAGYTETVCVSCTNGDTTQTVDDFKITQNPGKVGPHPTHISQCQRGSDKGCIDLYGANYCCMAVQALYVSDDQSTT